MSVLSIRTFGVEYLFGDKASHATAPTPAAKRSPDELRGLAVIPIQRTAEWLYKEINGLPADIRMVYIDSGEYVTAASDYRTVAAYDLFGFRTIPDGTFDPQNDDHVGDLGNWDYEAHPHCDFPDLPFDDYHWLEVLESAVRDPKVVESLNRRNVLLLFADHDGPITVLQ